LSQPKLTFKHVDSEIGALEAEEIGVEHLLRDVKDVNISSLTASVDNRLSGLKALKTRLSEIDKYLSQVISDKMPINQSIIYQLQNIFNLLPRLDDEKQKSFITKTNDAMMIMYLSSMLRSVVSLHDLIENKISLREEEVKLAKQQQEKQKNTKKTASNASKPEEDQKTSFSD
jgi:26S proteasome regulatory subunit N8